MNSLVSIQVLRAIAAWLVVFYHEYDLLFIRQFQHYPQSGYFGVDVFFVISGFIMVYSLAHRDSGAREFFLRRVIRIVPAYWFYTLLMVFFSGLYVEEFSYTKWDLSTLWASLLFFVTNNPSGIGHFPLLTVGWTLSFEMFFYVLLSLCIFAFGKYRYIACALILVILPFVWDDYQHYRLSTKLLYEFVLGMAICFGYMRIKNIRPMFLYISGIVLLLMAVFFLQMDIGYSNGGELGLKRSLLACLLVSSLLCFESVLSRLTAGVFKWIRYAGDISYSTYLLHPIVIGVLLHYAGIQNSAGGEVLLMISASAIVFIASHLSYRYIEVGPVAKILKNKFVR